jgi:hypothetical protein
MPIMLTESADAEVLEFDAEGSGPNGEDPGSPLTIGPGTNYGLIEHAYPSPPLNVEGELPDNRRYGNREITIRLEMVDNGGGPLADLQDKVAKLQREGGTLKRTDKHGNVRIYDLIAADGWNPVYDLKCYLGDLTEVAMTLPAKPIARGEETQQGPIASRRRSRC